MKVIALALLALATSSAAPRESGDLADQIAQGFAWIQSVIPEDSELTATYVTLTIPENYFENGQVLINRASLTGLKDGFEYDVSEDITATTAQYSASVYSFIALLDISVNISGLVDFQDDLYIKIELEKAGVKGSLTFTDTDYKELSEFDILFGLDSSEVKIKGIGSEEYDERLSADLSTAIPEVINNLAETYEEKFSEDLKKVINDFLKS